MRYEKIIQESHCCVPACLQMILKRNGFSYKSQEDIGYELGLIVSEESKHLFNKVRVGERPIAGYGVQIQVEEYSLNNFFKNNKIPLFEEYYYIENLDEIKKFLIWNKDNDIIVIFHCATLYDAPHADWGHAVIIDHLEDDNVVLVETSKKRDFETVSLNKLAESIKKHGKEKGGGFWLIKKVT